ncbi:MAG: hypothetical protein HY892_06545 [Deltaproteobacteria bacterium]|nr:hypothetical protein [Deltaproteobacteria bacterium]
MKPDKLTAVLFRLAEPYLKIRGDQDHALFLTLFKNDGTTGRKEREMVTLIFEYDIPIEKQAEYIQLTKEKIKPLWESVGCQGYDIWQVAGSETRFFKTMLFGDMSAMQATLARKETDSAKEIFGKFAENVSRKVCTKKT